jgi:hypothetical protein
MKYKCAYALSLTHPSERIMAARDAARICALIVCEPGEISGKKRKRGPENRTLAALSGSKPKAPGFAGGYLAKVLEQHDVDV